MLEDALGSRTKVRILRELVLRGGQELTTEDLVTATGQSTGTLVPALQQLAANGVVSTRLVGRTRVFRLNENHAGGPLVRRLFVEETTALHAAADAALLGLPRDGLRFVAWHHDPDGDERRFTAWVFVIVDDPSALDAYLAKAFPDGGHFRVRVVSVEEARQRIADEEPTILRAIERGRVVYADRAWLDE